MALVDRMRAVSDVVALAALRRTLPSNILFIDVG